MFKNKKKPAKKGLKSMRRNLIISLLSFLSSTKEKAAAYAYQNTRFYHKLYSGLIKNRAEIKSIAFQNLPLAKKQVINQFMPLDFLSRKMEKKVFKYAETTGSAGSPTPSFFTQKEFLGSVLLSKLTPYASQLKKILNENRRAVCGLACGFTIAGLSFQQVLDRMGFLSVNVDARTTISPPHRVARLLSRFLPSVIIASETDFLAWMKVLKEEYINSYEKVLNHLKILISTAELCSENRSRQICRHFDIIHIDTYACVEGYFSVPCPCGEKHILPIYHTEVLSDNLKHSSPLGKGRFAFTQLHRKSTPFVRYLLDDLVTIYPSKCGYGFTKSIIPHGRYELSVKINQDRYGTRDFENLLFKSYLFGEYQVQVYHDKISIEAENYCSSLKPPIQEIKNDFKQHFKLETEIKIMPYGYLRDYRKIREKKPILRLKDQRVLSTQKIPRYL